MGSAVSVGGVALGAKIIEKHMTLRRSDGGADSKFSMRSLKNLRKWLII